MKEADIVRTVEIIRIIKIHFVRGKGKTMDDPIRGIDQYWSLKGELLAENDPIKEGAER